MASISLSKVDKGHIVARMSWACWRRFAGTYLSLFFLAVAAAPHQHLNGLEDLLLDQPSDSGEIVLNSGPVETPQDSALTPFSRVRDVPCLACFTKDFVGSPAATIAFVPCLSPLSVRPVPPSLATPELLPAEAVSRAPPRIS